MSKVLMRLVLTRSVAEDLAWCLTAFIVEVNNDVFVQDHWINHYSCVGEMRIMLPIKLKRR